MSRPKRRPGIPIALGAGLKEARFHTSKKVWDPRIQASNPKPVFLYENSSDCLTDILSPSRLVSRFPALP